MFQAAYSQMQHATNLWRKAFEEHLGRCDAMIEEITKIETKGFEQACSNVDETARLAKESFAYASLLGAQWRKLAIDASRQAADLVGRASKTET